VEELEGVGVDVDMDAGGSAFFAGHSIKNGAGGKKASVRYKSFWYAVIKMIDGNAR
jgi:hypothetical protein